jgi:hypothetical protein
MFRTVPLSIMRSFSLYTHQWYMSYTFADSLWAGLEGTAAPSWSCSQAVSKPVWHIPFLCVQWKTPHDGQRNYPKHVEFNSKNKFEKLVHLVGFIIRNLSRRMVTWTSNLICYHCTVENWNAEVWGDTYRLRPFNELQDWGNVMCHFNAAASTPKIMTTT